MSAIFKTGEWEPGRTIYREKREGANVFPSFLPVLFAIRQKRKRKKGLNLFSTEFSSTGFLDMLSYR